MSVNKRRKHVLYQQQGCRGKLDSQTGLLGEILPTADTHKMLNSTKGILDNSCLL